ncbi:alanine racemase [Psychrobacter sp. DM4]|uniref:alanine racemase n=1 Tax=Psychrobacter sp. DM4 TaxID=3440637 RepID=UPI003F500440
MRTATVTINPQAMTHNLMQVKKRAPNAKVLAMVKANAYGHGVAAVLPALVLADAIGVASFTEALEARHLGWDKAIGLVEGVFSADEWQQAIDNGCSCVIHHAPQLEWALECIPAVDSPVRTVWLKYNTGMNRLGFDEQGVVSAAKRLHGAGYALILTTHFANADDREHPLTSTQIQRFNDIFAILQRDVDKNIKASLCNSAGIVNYPDSHCDWVRPGIMLYGSSPVTDQSASELNLQAVMDFSAQIMAFQTVKQGATIGYGSRWSAEEDTRTALVSVGYGDGYPRVVNNDAHVNVVDALTKDSYTCPVIGRVAMDMLVIDVSSTPIDLALDSEVILWGAALPVDDVAQHAGTISYELLCRLSNRPLRVIV